MATGTSDARLRERLTKLDQDDDVTVSSWEADFIESVCFKKKNSQLSEKQRDLAEKILAKYGY